MKPKGVTTNESSRRVHSNGTVCVVTEKSSFSCQRNLKVCPQMKALGKYILMVLFMLLLKRVKFLTTDT